jgi:hypothetical protein
MLSVCDLFGLLTGPIVRLEMVPLLAARFRGRDCPDNPESTTRGAFNFLRSEKPELYPDERSDVQSLVVAELASAIASSTRPSPPLAQKERLTFS